MTLADLRSLSSKKQELPKSTGTVPGPMRTPPIPPMAPAPAVASIANAVGLIKFGTPVPLDSREVQRALPFEDQTKQRLLLDRLKRGFAPKVVVKALGWSGSWASWKKRAAQQLEPYATFMLAVEQAEAEGACHLMDQIERAGEGTADQHGIWKNNWQASKYMLEVLDPTIFKPVEKSFSLRAEVPADMIKFDVAAMSDADLEALVEIGDRAKIVDVEVVSD